jgi:hypothetical protein
LLDDGPRWRTPPHFVGESERVLAATRERGLEGVVAKRLGSHYLPGARSGAWLKRKDRRVELFVVTGWSPAEPRRPESLLLARVGSDGMLEPAGSVPLVLGNGQATTSGDGSCPSCCRRLAAVSASAASRRRCVPRSRSTAHPAGPCATRSFGPSPRSNRRARRRPVQDPPRIATVAVCRPGAAIALAYAGPG